MRLLLIDPGYPEYLLSLKWLHENIFPTKKVWVAPLGVATIAALTPAHWEVEIIDENVSPVPAWPEADVIAIGGMESQSPRALALLDDFRQKGYYTVAGGSNVTLCPERYQGRADTLVIGEAELTWPQFCHDFTAGKAKPVYQQIGAIDIETSPVPRWDLLDLDAYDRIGMQPSRGCPYVCEFCNVIITNGRKPRFKSPAQIWQELAFLRDLGVTDLFLCDDNFLGDRRRTWDTLNAMNEFRDQYDYRFSLFTQIDITIAQQDEMMEAMVKAGFDFFFIGIESISEDSLRDVKKLVNTRAPLVDAVHKIYAKGIDVGAGLIVGFDTDTTATFGLQLQFIKDTGLALTVINPLSALPRTPIYARLEAEGRLRKTVYIQEDGSQDTNVIPKNMSYEQLMQGLDEMTDAYLTDQVIAERIHTKLKHWRPRALRQAETWSHTVPIIARMLWHGILPGGPRRWFYFLRSWPITSPSTWNVWIRDWLTGLTVGAYHQSYRHHRKTI